MFVSGVYFLYMKTKKGFTLVEIMIVIVIMGTCLDNPLH